MMGFISSGVKLETDVELEEDKGWLYVKGILHGWRFGDGELDFTSVSFRFLFVIPSKKIQLPFSHIFK